MSEEEWASVLQCIAVSCSVHVFDISIGRRVGTCVAVCCSVLQCVAVCCSMLQCVVVCCRVSQSSAV